MSYFTEKYFSTRQKKSLAGVCEAWRKKMVSPSRKIVSSSRNKLPLAGIFLENWISPYFNNGFYQQKESSKIH